MKAVKKAFILFIFIILAGCFNSGEEELSIVLDDPWFNFGNSQLISYLIDTPMFPDKASRYDVFAIRQATGDFDTIKVTGQFPHARYFSFNLYDFEVADELSAIADYEIVPDEGSFNPYIPGQNRDITNRYYTLYVVKEGVQPPADALNVMVIPSNIELVTLMTRVYRPDDGADSLGDVTLPWIEVSKSDNTPPTEPNYGLTLADKLSKLPAFINNPELIATWEYARQFAGTNVDFFRLSTDGLLPNMHNKYLVAALDESPEGKVAILSFIPPTFEDTYTGNPFTGGKETRYWSICVGSLDDTSTSDCIIDDEASLNADGTVTIYIAGSDMEGIIRDAGLNYVNWGDDTEMGVIFYRQMLAEADFPGNVNLVEIVERPPAPENISQEYYDSHKAQNWLGAYAPTGVMLTTEEFITLLAGQ